MADMADRYGMNKEAFEATIRKTLMPANISVSNEQLAAFLLVAKQFNLDPITKQIFAYPAKGGGIQAVVSIDGWMTMINNHPQFDGMEFDDVLADGKLIAITCRMYRKDRNRPVSVTEYMEECKQNSPTWSKWPARMLRHKAAIQAARYAFSFSGIVDEDEAQRMIDVTPKAEQHKPEHKPEAPSRLASIMQQAAPTTVINEAEGELIEAEHHQEELQHHD